MLRGRHEAAQFARRMVYTLSKPRNAEKPGWKECEIGELENKLKEEFNELMLEIANLRSIVYSPNAHEYSEDTLEEQKKRVAEEATDLGCVSMMITDIVGGLDDG